MNRQLYESDFYAWTQQQAQVLQAEDFAELDLPNLIEELEAMGRSQKSQLANRLRVLLMHLLKLQYQPGRASKSWRHTIREQRRRLELLLDDNPSLCREVPDRIVYAYARAREDASDETGLAIEIFPTVCSYSVEQIFATNWLP
jgi:Domain of unknown function DUF29